MFTVSSNERKCIGTTDKRNRCGRKDKRSRIGRIDKRDRSGRKDIRIREEQTSFHPSKKSRLSNTPNEEGHEIISETVFNVESSEF